MGKVVVKTSTMKIVENKNGTRSTYTSYTVNGKKKWSKTGGFSNSRSRKK